ncbi:hypothetical protein Tsubulata_031114 [Turnera subulata]|uniref:DUF4283 domain-containing protein n=1 Tax=Turnera subulata TaxID=218843 RepID=A0A9Q0FZK9_9ROSI|nr:hypothetical protein Tsubulata_031114 [Turnera subulata]
MSIELRDEGTAAFRETGLLSSVTELLLLILGVAAETETGFFKIEHSTVAGALTRTGKATSPAETDGVKATELVFGIHFFSTFEVVHAKVHGMYYFESGTCHEANEAAYSCALCKGPWHVGGIPLLLWPWSSSFKKMDLSSAIFPVWIKLKNVPLELLTAEGLSYLASTLGQPLHTDRDCSKLFNSDSVNICVQVDFAQPLLKELKLDLNGETVIIDVVYSWQPPHCELCKNWGHHEIACTTSKVEKIETLQFSMNIN